MIPATFEDLVLAYLDCRRAKRNTVNALLFEQDLERNLIALFGELVGGTYQPGRSICFVVTRPRPREVWAAAFRDRVVHHLLYNRIAERFHRAFIVDSCACIPGRGTMFAAERLQAKVRSITQGGQRQAFYLKCDLTNFFVAIDKRVLWQCLAGRIPEPWWRDLAHTVLWHDPRTDYELRTTAALLQRVPPHKRLAEQPAHLGLPIGNLSSQFFANVYLDRLDQFVKHDIGARHYIRYVDDFILLHESPNWLNAAHGRIAQWLPDELGARLNPAKTILQPVSRGIDFVGQQIAHDHRTLRRRTFNAARSRVAMINRRQLFETANSYFGLLRQASHSHHDRARLANVMLKRGRSVNRQFTKTHRKEISA